MNYVFREVPPEETDSSYYFELDRDYDYEDIAIDGGRQFVSHTGDEVKSLIEFIKYRDKSSLKELLPHYGMTSVRKEAFQKAAKQYENDESLEALAEAMTAITDQSYVVKSIRGYSQGDYAEVMCREDYDLEQLEAYFFNKGTEFISDEKGNFYCYQGYNDETYKKELSAYSGIPVKNIKLRMFTGYSRKATYAKAC